MQIHLRTRRNKVNPSNLHGGEFIIFDNATMVAPSKKIACDINDFKDVLKTKPTPRANATVHFEMKNPRFCESDEDYHYNCIQWVDRITNQKHILFFDTVVFLCNDEGKTQQKIEG